MRMLWSSASLLRCATLRLSDCAGIAVELSPRGRLLHPYAPGHDLRTRIAFRSHRRSQHAAEHRQLTDVGERVCKRSLDQFLDRTGETPFCGELAIEDRELVEEAVPNPGGGSRSTFAARYARVAARWRSRARVVTSADGG
jgi:hypothetical protein